MKIKIQTITPEKAKALLSKNIRNRTVRNSHVNDLAHAMKSGHWSVNGDSIRLNGDNLVDGQHRLLACIKSKTPFQTLVISDLDFSTFHTIDQGLKRSHADTLHVRGEDSPLMLGAALVLVHKYQMQKTGGYKISNTELPELLEKHHALRESVQYLNNFRKMFIPHSILIAGHYMFAKNNRATADEFIEQVCTGVGLQHRDPALVLRERIMSERSRSGTASCLPRVYTLVLLVKAWNAYVDGRKIASLRWRTAKNSTELFPKVK